MGLRGPHAAPKHLESNGAAPSSQPKPIAITPKAIAIYKMMRRHERQQGGPGDDEWWAMNAELARCLGVAEGMVVAEDPAWGYSRPMQSALDRFHQLEDTLRKQPKDGHRYKFKWER